MPTELSPFPADVADSEAFLVFGVGPWKLALPLERVLRVLPVMETLPLPGVPPVIAGVIRLDDTPVPVVDLRVALGAPVKRVEAADVLLLTSTPVRDVALWVDGVEGVSRFGRDALLQAAPLFGENRLIRNLASRKDDLILIYNLEEILVPEEEDALAEALRAFKK